MIINMNGAKAPETPSPVLQEKTVTPETLPTVIGADEGYDGLSQVTVNPDAQLKAENIRSGKTIFGVTGAFVGEPQPVADPVAQFWMDLIYTNSVTEPANAPPGFLVADITLKENAFYDCYIGAEGLDLTGFRAYSDACLQKVHQKHFTNGSYSVPSGPITIKHLSSNMFQDSDLEGLPSGNWQITANTSYTFNGVKFYTKDIIVDESRVRDGVLPYGVFKGVYYGQKDVLTAAGSLNLTLPSNVTKMASNSVGGRYDGKLNLIMKATVPPTLEGNLSNINSITVPKGSLQSYQTATNWSKFSNIMTEATE